MIDAIFGALGFDWQALAALLIAGAVAIGAVFLKGRQSANNKAERADNDRANAIENAADRARMADDAGADPLGKLRSSGRIRD